MNDMPMYIAASIGVLLIVLGFAALLSQRIYLDMRTQSPIEIDIPIFGKMKANYPALVFVLLGCALTVYGLNTHHEAREVQWQVDGRLVAGSQGFNWQQGRLYVHPISSRCDIHIDDSGSFTIKLGIQEGKTLEDVIEFIDYTYRGGSVGLMPKNELENYKKTGPSMLTRVTNTTRTYKLPLREAPPPLDSDAGVRP